MCLDMKKTRTENLCSGFNLLPTKSPKRLPCTVVIFATAMIMAVKRKKSK